MITTLDTHPRTLRSNIWRGVLSATDQELHDGMHFYEGAYGLCRLIAVVFKVDVCRVAGVYAALSPMNGWLTNVSNVLSVFRWTHRNKDLDCKCADPWPDIVDDFVVCGRCGGLHSVSVNTPRVNRDKALRIASGESVLSVLRGHKVTAFYNGIANPSDTSPIPIDRHLINLALGLKVTSNVELRSLAGNVDLCTKIEQAYADLGQREDIGNRLASIAWFVQRRIAQGQIPILQPGRLVCCSRPMHAHGQSPRRWCCSVCGKSTNQTNIYHQLPPRFKTPPIAFLNGMPITIDRRGRKRIHLGRDHEQANKSGWQYLSRYKVGTELGRVLATDEHVHHRNLDKGCDTTDNYEVLLAERHGRYHTYIAEIAGGRGSDGRFTEYDVPIDLLDGVDADTFDTLSDTSNLTQP